jgi:hypothetical protein
MDVSLQCCEYIGDGGGVGIEGSRKGGWGLRERDWGRIRDNDGEKGWE